MFDALNDAIVATASSPWIYLIVFAVVFVDAFFPPVPSETLVVAAAAIGVSSGQPAWWAVILLAAIGASAGDNLTYWLGRRLGLTRFRWMRAPRTAKAIDWARRGLDRRAALLIITGRYIPIGRVAVNLTAGATRLPYRRFLPLSLIAGLSWALYSVAIGVLAGAWFEANPLLGAVVAVVIAGAIGIVIDRVISARTAARPLPTAATRTSTQSEPTLCCPAGSRSGTRAV